MKKLLFIIGLSTLLFISCGKEAHASTLLDVNIYPNPVDYYNQPENYTVSIRDENSPITQLQLWLRDNNGTGFLPGGYGNCSVPNCDFLNGYFSNGSISGVSANEWYSFTFRAAFRDSWRDSDGQNVAFDGSTWSHGANGEWTFSYNDMSTPPTPEPTSTPTPTPEPTSTPTPTPPPIGNSSTSWFPFHYCFGQYCGGSQTIDQNTYQGFVSPYFDISQPLDPTSEGYYTVPNGSNITSVDIKLNAEGTGSFSVGLASNPSTGLNYAPVMDKTNFTMLKFIESYTLNNSAEQEIDIHIPNTTETNQVLNTLNIDRKNPYTELGLVFNFTNNISITIGDPQIRFNYSYGTGGSLTNNNPVADVSSCGALSPVCAFFLDLFSPSSIDPSIAQGLQASLLQKAPFAYIVTALSFDTSNITPTSGNMVWDFSFTVPSTNGQPEKLVPLRFESDSHLDTWFGYFKTFLTIDVYLGLMYYFYRLARRVFS